MIFSPERQNVNPVTWPHKKAAGRMALQNPDFLVTQVDIKFPTTESEKKNVPISHLPATSRSWEVQNAHV